MDTNAHFKSTCRYLILNAAMILASLTATAQTCFEGDCNDGYGKKDFDQSFYVGAFTGGKFDGPGLRYGKENGAITMSYWQSGERTISIVEFHNGDLEFGYRTKSSDGKWRLYNGFEFKEEGLSKKINGQKSPLDFRFEGNACLIGDCQTGFGAEYLVVVSDNRADTSSYLYVGYYRDGGWNGEGGYYEFSSGDYFVGHFANNAEWNGAYFNEDTGLASFLQGGQEVKTMSYSIPADPPGVKQTQQQQVQNDQPKKKKGAFWKTLGEVALGTAVVAATIATSDNTKSGTSTNKTGTNSNSNTQKVNCKYLVEWWTEANDTKLVIEGVAIIKATSVDTYRNAGLKGEYRFFNSYSEAANFKQEKANVGISQGYEIGYKASFNELKQDGCLNR